MLNHINPSKILVFLPQTTGTTIVARLSECGFASVLVSTVPEAFHELRSNEFISITLLTLATVLMFGIFWLRTRRFGGH